MSNRYAPLCLDDVHLVVDAHLNDDGSVDDYRVWMRVPDTFEIAWRAQTDHAQLREIEGELFTEVPVDLTPDQERDVAMTILENENGNRADEAYDRARDDEAIESAIARDAGR